MNCKSILIGGAKMTRKIAGIFGWDRKNYVAALSLAVTIILSAAPSFADTYNMATFIGGIYGGDANAQSPFSPSIHQGGAISGGFIIDTTQTPGAGSGYVNNFFTGYPDIANIPAASAFNINLGTANLTFSLADALWGAAAIQFNNGNFNGFFYDTHFTYTDSREYDFSIQGRTWNISYIDPASGYPGQQYVSGYIDGMTLGDRFTPVVPGAPVPEPATILLLGAGLAGLGLVRRRAKK
jgi:hypothetical protein